MVIALLFNIEYQLLSIDKLVSEERLEMLVGINTMLKLKAEIKKIGDITNYLLSLLTSYRRAHLEADYEKYRKELYETEIDYDISNYNAIIDELIDGETAVGNFLKQYSLNYKIGI